MDNWISGLWAGVTPFLGWLLPIAGIVIGTQHWIKSRRQRRERDRRIAEQDAARRERMSRQEG